MGVDIDRIPGELTDNYDPRDNRIHLSQPVCDAATMAAVGVAAHEAGHAVQYAQGYGPVRVRTAIIPVCQFGATLSWPLLLLGIFFESNRFFLAGIILFCAVVLFQLVTLPVEFNASARAVRALEQEDFRRVLNGFLRKLTRQSRTFFLRRYWYGESIREIAVSCGAGEEKIKSSLFRTRQRLRTGLEKEGML